MSRAQDMANGKVQALIVVGDVQLIAPDGTSTALKRGQTFEQGNRVHANAGGNALLVMSNGATLKVKSDTTLDVATFQQAAYDQDTEGTFLRLNKDPSKSETDLKLSTGSLQGEVKKLNTDSGSKFTVDTPAGSAGIRGTIIDITIIRNAAGQVTGVIANCIVGNVGFTPAAGVVITNATGGTATTVTNANISGGGSMTVSLAVDPTTGLITGGSLSGTNLGANATQALADALNETVNQALVQAGLPTQPPPSIGTSTNTVTVTDANGNTSTISTNTVSPGAGGSGAAGSGTGAGTGTPVNSNPSTASPA
jgi:hypothetical protein